MKRITVSPCEGRWRVSVPLNAEASTGESYRFKFFAVRRARKMAKRDAKHNAPISVLIKDRYGLYQTEWTYPRSADPRRSKG